MADPAFKAAGQRPGLEIWRIEKLQVKEWDPKMYGKFCTGDAYIVLQTKKPPSGGGFEWHIHFWLGEECSQDEQGVAAYKTVELDDHLGGGPVQHREVQNHESKEFISLFPKKGIEYLAGGVESGFRKVERDRYEPRLLQVKGRRNIRVQQVKLSWSSMNHGDGFILDLGLKLWVWQGEEAGKMEKIKALEVARRIRDEERGGRAEVSPIDDHKEPEDFVRKMNELVTDDHTIKDIAAATSDSTFERAAKEQVKLYRVSDASGMLEINEVGSYPLKCGLLDTNDAFILDTGAAGIFAWIGRGATTNEKKAAFKNATEFISQKGYPGWTQVTMVREGAETPLFKQNFTDWLNKGEVTGLPKYEKKAVREEVKVEGASMHQQATRESEKMVDDGSGKIEIWRIEDFEPQPVPPEMYGQFYGGDSYIVLYTYLVNGKENYIIYFWLGQESSQDERAAAAMHTVALDDKYGGAPVQVRVVQYKEPEHFLQIFRGKMVIHAGGRASGFKNRFESDTYDVDGTRLFQVKGTSTLNTRAVQVEEVAASLNTNDCFVLETPVETYIWYGKGCSGDERDMANHVAGMVTPGREPQKIQEEREPDAFWEALGGKTEYHQSKVLEEVVASHPPRLFQCSNASGRFTVEEIFDFSQEDLIEDDVMILDTFDTVYVWVGRGANKKEKEEALRVATEYVRSDPSGRDEDNTLLIQIKQGFEPPTFTSHFFGWNPQLWASNKTYEQYLEELKSSGGGQAEKVAEVVAQAGVFKLYAYEELVDKCPPDVDPAHKEQHLSDETFQRLFKMTKSEFERTQKWKQQKIKKDLKLF